MRLKDNIHTKTLTAKLTLPQLNKIIVICHEFMRNNIGVNHSINNTLSSKVVNGKVTHNVCGEYNYDDVEITIYTKNNTVKRSKGGQVPIIFGNQLEKIPLAKIRR